MTKKQRAIYNAYINSNLETLFDCYERPSQEKHEIFQQCKKDCNAKNGINFSIISYNKYMFTIGYKFKDVNGKWWFHYETSKTLKEWLID